MTSGVLDIAGIRQRFAGSVIAPHDEGYDAARTVVYGGFDRRPAVIIQPRDAREVGEVIALARETGLSLAIRSGGHSPAAHSVIDDGIVLDLRGLKDLDIDQDERIAWVGAGMTAGEFTVAAARHGLAVPFGDTGSVGIGGITLGGGVGFLVRRFGLTIDSLMEAEVVTADGRVLVVSEDRHPDLFWALRGGGGNFGVVTRFKLMLHELPQVYGGMLFLPASSEIVAGFMAASESAPEELSGIGNVMSAPPMPFIPEELHGEMILMAFLCFAGPSEEGERALEPFRSLAPPLMDMLEPMSYAEMFPPEDDSYHPLAVARTMFMDRIGDQESQTIMRYLTSSDAPMRVAQLRVLGGAMARVPNDATAFAHRQSRIMVNVAAFYEGEDDRPQRQAWVDEFSAALRQDDDGAYVGFLGDEGPERVRAAYPGETWDRLTRVKAEYDPENMFRSNQNIPTKT